MRPIFIIFAFAFIFTSCQKKYTYWCQTSTINGADLNPVTLDMTEKEKDKYVKSHSVDVDGNTSTVIAGESKTICEKVK